MKITELIKAVDNSQRYSRLNEFEVQGIASDSRQVKEGFVFIAVKGSCQDGSVFADEAIARGAKAIVSEKKLAVKGAEVIVVKDSRKAEADLAAKFYNYPSSGLKVVGITGTNGKTTTTYLIEAILKRAKKNPAVIGTVNYRFGNKIIQAKNTTPGAIELGSLLSSMRQAGVGYCLMEVSSHSLDQQRVAGIRFHSAIFTNLTQDHLDYHKTMENYFQAKSKLFNGLRQGAYAVINADDRYAGRLRQKTAVRIVTYAIEKKAHLTVKGVRFGLEGTEFMLVGPKIKKHFKSRLIGRHNLYNIMAAVAWSLEEGIGLSAIKSAVEGFMAVPGRLQRINWPGDFSIFVDYAHTDDALENVLDALRKIGKKRIIVVFGCGGERDRLKRPKMGRVVSRLADYAIITNDNPRREPPETIFEEIKKGFSRDNYSVIPDRREAIRKSLSLANARDIILVAGKGHENYQIIGNNRIYFDDCEVIRECLAQIS